MFKKFYLLFVPFVVALFMSVAASPAFAYGQCGIGTNNPRVWVSQLAKMGVLKQTEALMARNGFHRMDGSYYSWVAQRVIAVDLRRPADPVDYGCHPGTIFSVGHRELPAGTPVFAVLPLRYAKNRISLHARKGWKRIAVCSNAAGKQNCTNPETGTFCYWLWIPVRRHVVERRRKQAPKPASCAGTVVVVNGQAVCQTNSNTTSQSGTTSGQGSPVINVNQTTQVTVNQGQQQGQSQSSGSTTAPTCQSESEGGIYPNCYTFNISGGTQPQEYWPNETNLMVCVTIGGAYQDVKSVQFSSDQYGAFLDGGLVTSPQPGSPSMWCDSTFATGSDMPPNNTSFVQATASDGSGYSASGTLPLTWTTSPTFM